MIKFVYKKRTEEEGEKGNTVIYYNFTDIFLGLILFGLVVFFINDYLSHSLIKKQSDDVLFQGPPLTGEGNVLKTN